MKDITTFETAVRLKEASFPQPTPEAGQFWYNPNGILFVVYLVHEIVELYEIGRRNPSIGHYWEEWTFAPTATDILRELPDKTALYRVNMDMFLCWIRKDRAPTIGDGPCMVNAAEAAAEAWVEWKEQTTTI